MGTFWEMWKKYRIFGKWDVEVWVRFDGDKPIDARKIIETNKSTISIPIKIPREVMRKRRK